MGLLGEALGDEFALGDECLVGFEDESVPEVVGELADDGLLLVVFVLLLLLLLPVALEVLPDPVG